MDAHLLMSHLESEGIDCWLQDENTVTTMPIWTNAVGGIKLMIREGDAVRARQILGEIEIERKLAIECPKCKGHNIELISSPRNVSNWISAILGFLFVNYALPADKINHCFDCGHEFTSVNETGLKA